MNEGTDKVYLNLPFTPVSISLKPEIHGRHLGEHIRKNVLYLNQALIVKELLNVSILQQVKGRTGSVSASDI